MEKARRDQFAQNKAAADAARVFAKKHPNADPDDD